MERHPKLAEKFKLLYFLQLNPRIKTHADLAREVGVSKQAITKWVRGSSTSRGNAIPLDQVSKVASHFGISPHWMSLSFEKFEKKIRKITSRGSQLPNPEKVRISTGTLPITDLNLFGRDSELALLDKLWEDNKANVVEIVAFGGAGKSALINKWLSELNKANYRGARNVYAWSFYWQSETVDTHSAGDYFIEHALEWFGDPYPDRGTHWSKAERLVDLIRQAPTLLILDGLETLQHSSGSKFGMIDNPALSILVKEMASENKGLCILTTRFCVKDLESFRDGRVHEVDISPLSSQSSRQLLRHLGVVGNPGELDRVSGLYSGHPLSLVLVAGYLSIAHEGELNKFTAIKSNLGDRNKLVHLRKLVNDYLQWLSNKPGLQILRLLCLFGKGVSVTDLVSICKTGVVSGLTDKLENLSEVEWNFAIEELQRTRLIVLDRNGLDSILDCHPLIRDYVEERMRIEMESTWILGNELIFRFLIARLDYMPARITDMDPFFRAVIHGVRAGKYEEAFNFYYYKIKNKQFSMLAEGSHYADQACIKSFFVNEWDVPIQSLHEDAQHYLTMSAATNLIYLGNIEEATGPSMRSIEWFRNKNAHLQVALATGPLVSMYIASGDLRSATKLLDEVEEDVWQAKNSILDSMLLTFRAYILFLEGNSELAGVLFEQAEKELTKPIPDASVEFPTISSYYCKFLLETGKHQQALERSLKTMAWRDIGTWQVAVDTNSLLASDILVLGLVFLALGDKANARVQMQRQVEIFHSASEWLYLPTGLNSRARFYAAVKNFEAARKDLQSSLEISQRTGAKFGEWEAHIDLAQLHLSCDAIEDAKESLENAVNIPGMSHYKFRDREIRELKDKLALH